MEVPVVTLDVVATTAHGDMLTGLKKENFRVFDDGVPQTITNFGPTDAPITMVMLMEFSSRGYVRAGFRIWRNTGRRTFSESDSKKIGWRW